MAGPTISWRSTWASSSKPSSISAALTSSANVKAALTMLSNSRRPATVSATPKNSTMLHRLISGETNVSLKLDRPPA